MLTKDWYKLSFEIDSDLEELIIWKLNDLGIFSYSFEYLLKNKNIKIVNVWLPTLDWEINSKKTFEKEIRKLLTIRDSKNKFFTWTVIEEEDWLTHWKKFWTSQPVGENLIVLPCWLKLHQKYKNKKIIKIDPGAAFGTGSHPTTYLCLEKMEKKYFVGKKVLDIGSGSGILSVAARSFGAKEICAIDNDYLAINSTKSNFQLNFGDLDYLETYLGTFNEVTSKYCLHQFDYILCNILAEVIKEIIPKITNFLRDSGEIILSGILSSQKDEILATLKLYNLKLLEVSSKKEWVCITVRKSDKLDNA